MNSSIIRAALSALASFACFGCGGGDFVESRYEDHAAAAAAGAMTRGWLPSFLPASATTIREAHNLDTNEVWATFMIAPGAMDDNNACQRSDRSGVLLPRRAGIGWWPDALSERSAEEPPAVGYTYFRCGTTAFIAVDGSSGAVYYWQGTE